MPFGFCYLSFLFELSFLCVSCASEELSVYENEGWSHSLRHKNT